LQHSHSTILSIDSIRLNKMAAAFERKRERKRERERESERERE
jgi:hypothetical protein